MMAFDGKKALEEHQKRYEKRGLSSRLSIRQIEEIYRYNADSGSVREEDLAEIISLIPKPFLNARNIKDADVLSIIFNNFIENTEIPLALPIFSFLSIFSAFCVRRDLTYMMPLGLDKKHLDTWNIVLADSGSAKTFSIDQINKILPTDIDGELLIESNVSKPNGPAKFIEDLSYLPESLDGKNQLGFWFEDEVAQTIKSIENPSSPMSELKEYLLKIKDNKSVSRRTKQEEIKTKPIVLTFLGLNTKESFAKNISEESIFDGFLRRFCLVFASKDERDFTDYALYDMSKIRDQNLIDKMNELFNSVPSEVTYTFSPECKELYEKYFKIFWHRKYKNILIDRENFYRTYMMESWKYAVFHHLILMKDGTEIDEESLFFGFKISLVFAESLKNFLDYKRLGNSKNENTLAKYVDFLKENPDVNIRDFYRKFSMKKSDAIKVLEQIISLEIEHSILDEVQSEIEKAKAKKK